LACALALTSPLFGCATVPKTLSSQIVSIAPEISRPVNWDGYRQLLEQRIADQATGDFMPAQPRVVHLAARQEALENADVIDPQAIELRILAAHNRERQELGLTPLRWNPQLAESARRWADHLASTGRFEHAPESRYAPEGENLWAGSKGYFTPEAMVNAWIREKKFFRPGTFPDNSITGRVEDVGHYTQVVWRATTQVGCAQARGRSEDVLVCRYAEAGNYRGEVPF
jgi:hypothetical protein